MGYANNQYSRQGRWVRSRAVTNADTGGAVAVIDVPADTFIPAFGVSLVIKTAFSGGVPSLDVGDSAAADGWIDTTEITEGTPGTYTGLAAAFAVTGKYYSAANQIKVTLSAALAAGKAYVLAYLLDVSDIIDD